MACVLWGLKLPYTGLFEKSFLVCISSGRTQAVCFLSSTWPPFLIGSWLVLS